jgi:hypothetical protein
MCLTKLALVAAMVGMVSTPAHALTNGSFEFFLDGWSTLGDVTRGDTFVSSGHVGVLLGTASVDYEDDYPLLGAGDANFSGEPAAPVGLAGGLEEFIGLPIGALDPDAGDSVAAYEGSAIKQTFTVQAGDTLRFDWMYATIDPWLGDYAFVSLNQQVYRLGDLSKVTSVDDGIGFSTPDTFSHTFAQPGSVTLALGVVDVTDYNGTSALLVDNVTITPVPEPETYALMFAGLGLLGWRIRRSAAK